MKNDESVVLSEDEDLNEDGMDSGVNERACMSDHRPRWLNATNPR
jgi:hypothetical protein